MARINAYISDDIKTRAQIFAIDHHVSLSTLIRDALFQLMEHDRLDYESDVNYEYFTFEYPDGGFGEGAPYLLNIGDDKNDKSE